MKRFRMFCNRSGFTLIELMIVVGMIGLMGVVTVPNIIGAIPDYRLKNAARSLYSDMQWARLSAIKENQSWAMVFNSAAGTYSICADSGTDGLWSTLAGNDIRKSVTLSDYKSSIRYGHGDATAPVGSTFSDEISFTDDIAVFNARGTGDAGFVYLENFKATTTYAVGKRTSGSIVIRKWNRTSSIWE